MKERKPLQMKAANGFKDKVMMLRKASCSSDAELYSLFKSNENGLGAEEVEKRLQQYGLNEVQHEKPHPWYKQLLSAFINPFIGILVFIAGISAIIDIWLPRRKKRTTPPLSW